LYLAKAGINQTIEPRQVPKLEQLGRQTFNNQAEQQGDKVHNK
jgi:hypothetical protein